MLFQLLLAIAVCAATGSPILEVPGQHTMDTRTQQFEITRGGPGRTEVGVNFPINERVSGSFGGNLHGENRAGLGLTYTGAHGATIGLGGSVGQTGPEVGVGVFIPFGNGRSNA